MDETLAAIERVILGKGQQVRLCLTCLLARGHLLIEDVPGVGKTTLAHCLARVLGLEWTRVQFTSAVRSSPSCCWPMRSIAPAPRRRAPCWKPWRSVRSASMA